MDLAFVAILVYKMISRTVRATQKKLVSTNKQIRNKTKPKESNSNKRTVRMLQKTSPQLSDFSMDCEKSRETKAEL